MLLRELFNRSQKPLLEGGNIWPDTESFDQVIAQDLANTLEKYLSDAGLEVYRIGSGATPTPGKISGDLDVMVDLNQAAENFQMEPEGKQVRITLEKFLQSKGLETKKSGVQVHVKLPFHDKFHQVDIKVVPKAGRVHRFHVHDIPKGSPYKGVNKQMMITNLAIHKGLLWSPDEGLFKRNELGKKSDFLSDDLDEIAQYLLGSQATARDLGSVESIMAAIPDESLRNDIFAKARASSSWQTATPDAGANATHLEENDFEQDPNFAKYSELMAKYDMLSKEISPDATGLNVQKNTSPQFIQQVNLLKKQAKQLAGPNIQAWEQARKITTRQSNSQLATHLQEAAPSIGRKYQHIEDLVFTNGSIGGLHAIERLQSMTGQGGNIELKWDGSPVIYWGRDENGTFYMIPKNAWEYLKRGKTKLDTGVSTAPRTPDEVQRFILGTGKVDPDKEAIRKQFAREMSQLWPYLEQASPERGFVEGGLLFHPGAKPTLNNKTGEYEFTPNITTFHIGQSTELGQRIGKAKVMVAVTGYYPELGSSDEGRMPDAESLSTPQVIVQGTTYAEPSEGLEISGLLRAQDYISQNANLIDNFIAPKPGLSKPGDVLYKFYNQNLRTLGVKQKFHDWVTRNVSAGQSQKILADHAGLNAVLDAVEMITHAKLELINSLSAGTHGGIRQTKPEGYVQAHPGSQFTHDVPGQFVKAIDQANWSPDKER
jgi:hypothetical protein